MSKRVKLYVEASNGCGAGNGCCSEVHIYKSETGRAVQDSFCIEGWNNFGLPTLPPGKRFEVKIRIVGLKKAKKSKKLETVEV